MDMSKLPKFSKTPARPDPPPDRTPPIDYQPSPHTPAPQQVGAGAEAAFCIVFGVILLLLNPTFLKFLFTISQGHPFRPFVDPSVDYVGTMNFWRDLAMTSFAAVLLLHGLILLVAARALFLFVALVLIAAVTLGNLVYVAWSYPTDGLALIETLAVVCGVYLLIQQWRRIQMSLAGANTGVPEV